MRQLCLSDQRWITVDRSLQRRTANALCLDVDDQVQEGEDTAEEQESQIVFIFHARIVGVVVATIVELLRDQAEFRDG